MRFSNSINGDVFDVIERSFFIGSGGADWLFHNCIALIGRGRIGIILCRRSLGSGSGKVFKSVVDRWERESDMSNRVQGMRRGVVGGAAVAVAAVVAVSGVGSASADPGPGRLNAGAVSVPRAALPGWSVASVSGGGVGAVVTFPGGGWSSQVQLGATRADGRSSTDVARSIVLNAPRTPGYSRNAARVVGLSMRPTSVSGVSATLATGTIEVQGAPVKADRFRVIVVDSKPQSYFVSAVPFEAGDRIAQADAAERGLVAGR
ncbi:Uncharacterised protein [Tsukamurella paurometabola]|uniref:Uncharacterized protein n=1 Tax=Tsukamurella paurometabola TaxID=2061 RepID=A0A3P8L5X6_TSUPA|nr:Uncharacterised protein [Tsukamurella paurometabola]